MSEPTPMPASPAPAAAAPALERHIEITPYRYADAAALSRELGIGHPLAQVLVRRGLADPAAARAWLAAEDRHDPAAFAGMEQAVALVLRHVAARTRITVHGDYDVDGVCATAVLVLVLRRLGADVDWFLPGRLEDGYGLQAATLERLAARGTRLLLTADCGITSVEEVAAACAAGLDVVVTDHHAPRADGALPAAPIVHPRVGGYPCADLCAAGVAHKLAAALLRAAGADAAAADADLDLVALATVADLVPLRGENRRLVRAGLRALASTARPGLRALMRVAQVDPSRVDETAVGFRLAPRINAAGRLARADAGLELLLTEDEERAAAVAQELDALNAERRATERRILFEAEALVGRAGARPAHVLAGEGWHPGVIGIVASRIAERHHRPAVLIALDGGQGTGSGRSIPGFDLLGGLDACAAHLLRHGGHRAAAGLTIAGEEVDAFRAAFEAHAGAVLTEEDLIPREPADAVVSGDALGLSLAEELMRLAPFGAGNPGVRLLVPAATFGDARPLGKEGRHSRFTVESGGARARAVAFGVRPAELPGGDGAPLDATFRLEANEWNGAVEPRLLLGHAAPSAPAPITLAGEPEPYLEALVAELGRELTEWPPLAPSAAASEERRTVVDRRGHGIAGTLADLVASGEAVLAVCADARRRRRALAGRLGGFALCSWRALEREGGLPDPFAHVVALDPPAHAHLRSALLAPAGAAAGGAGPGFAHLAWGTAELRFAQQIHEREFDLRGPLTALYRSLRAQGGAEGEELEAALIASGPQASCPTIAARVLRVLEELRLVSLDRDLPALRVLPAERTALERSVAFRAYQRRHEDGLRFLSSVTSRAGVAA